MDIPTTAQLLDTIDAFRARHDIAVTRFGREAVGNPNFLRGLGEGVSPTLDTLIKVKDYMARTDAEAASRAKLSADIAPPEPPSDEVELPLPFRPAPATGASSATCSSTSAPPQSSAANGSSPTSSCCAPDMPGPSTPTVAGEDKPLSVASSNQPPATVP